MTLTGVGGVGKTRLAIQVAAELLPDFPDGAWLCELASVSDPDAVWDTLAASLGVHPSPGRSLDDSVLEYLGPKRLLLVLDNCEHLLDATATAVDRIGQRCPRRRGARDEPGGLGGGRRAARRGALARTPRRECARSTCSRPRPRCSCSWIGRTTPRPTSRSPIATRPPSRQLCRRLDGIPLAIELAASARAVPDPRRSGRPSRPALQAPHPGQPRRAGASSDAAQHDRLVL